MQLVSKYTLLPILFTILAIAVYGQTCGADQPEKYLSLLKGKRVGLVINQTAMVGNQHLVDFLKEKNVQITGIFAPEHGFRGNHAAGEKVQSGIDAQTGIKVLSLYGSKKKPTAQMLKEMDVLVFDIQDVGARFYTYISTLHYVMEACAEQKKSLIVLDRPNPNGHYIDGPILDTAFKSFVGMHKVPVVHGCTIGEYARMINGEKWLKNQVKCKLTVIPVKDYTHKKPYKLPVKPSPNLPNMASVYLYPTLCFFEGTPYSIGRGTPFPFQIVGKPGCLLGSDTFTPRHLPGIAEHPPQENKLCKGINYSSSAQAQLFGSNQIDLQLIIDFYTADTAKQSFFTPFFDTLAGTDTLRKQIVRGATAAEIRQSWQPGLARYKTIRKKYLLYPDF